MLELPLGQDARGTFSTGNSSSPEPDIRSSKAQCVQSWFEAKILLSRVNMMTPRRSNVNPTL